MIPSPAASSTSEVESYDEEMYRWRSGDTFARLSEAYYHTDKYDRALLLFNRQHPRAIDGIRQEPPALESGQVIYIPPARILERNYPQVIPDRLAPAAAPAAAPPAVGLAPPVRQASPAGLSPSAVSAWNTPPQERPYRVRRGGEWFLEIARHTLNSGDRWWEIARLNPRYNPQERVPEGTILRLPSDARLDPQDTP